MGRQQSKRDRQLRKVGSLPNIGRPLANSPPTYLFRSVLEPSCWLLNKATRGIRSGGSVRIVDNFSLTLVYPRRLMQLRERSPLTDVPKISTMATRLGNVSLDSLRKPVTATVEGVEPFSDVIGVTVSYSGYDDEQEALCAEIKDLLGFNPKAEIRIGPGKPHIGVVAGSLAVSQMKKIESRLPEVIEFGYAQNVNGPI